MASGVVCGSGGEEERNERRDHAFVPPSLIWLLARSLLLNLRWLDTVFQDQYLPSLSINYVAINKVLKKLPPQLY